MKVDEEEWTEIEEESGKRCEEDVSVKISKKRECGCEMVLEIQISEKKHP